MIKYLQKNLLLILFVFAATFNVFSQVNKSLIEIMPPEEDCPSDYEVPWYYDADRDGFGGLSVIWACYSPSIYYVDNNDDCDDSNPNINIIRWYYDGDGDGFGDSQKMIYSCSQPIRYVSNASDCDDTNPSINPNTKWFLDANEDGEITSIDGSAVYTQCSRPGPNYIISTAGKHNWIHVNIYNLVGNQTGASRTYFDDFGKANLTLTKDFVQNKIWGTETTYDSFGRADKTSFIAPSPLSTFGKVGFLSSNPNYPSVANLTTYYSDNNSLEPYQATASQPYSQTNYDKLNPGKVINVVGGNKINGEWKTGYSYIVPAAQEMYYVYGSNYYDGPIISNREEVITKFYKSVSIDANGVENVAFSDGEGKILASARSGGTISYPVISLIGTQGFVDVHIPSGITTTQISLIGGASLYKVYDLKTGLIVYTLTGGNAYRIQAITPPATDPKTYISSGMPTYDAGALGISYRVNYYDYAVNVYNKTGQLVKSIQPNGYAASTTIVASPAYLASSNFASTYTYNDQGQIKETNSPDEGTSKFIYRKDGQIRYSQSALQNDTKVSYTDYDSYGRPIESGVIANTWANAILNSDATLITGARTEQTVTVYDYPENNVTSVQLPTSSPNLTLTGVLTTAGIPTANYTQNNLSGNVAITYTKPGTHITAITWYSYDIYGRTEWMVQYNDGIGAKTIHYSYDFNGNVTKVLYQKDKTTELFVHRYSYNGNGILTKVETSTDNSYFITHAEYTYYQTGELKRVNIAQGLQGVDYVYTLGGQLKSINHPSLEAAKDPGGDTNDIFGITLDYYSGDYLRTGKNITTSPTAGADYNGNIKAARWANKSTSMDYISNIVNQKGYLYNYDRNNWLTGATFGNTNANTAAITPTTNYTEAGLTYDPNGNIKTLQRTNNSGAIVDNLTYNYTNTGKNQLNNVNDAVATPADGTDIEGQTANNYVYDAIGQMTRNIQENLYYFYNTQGLVTEVRKGVNPVVKFFYNERGQRIKKESFDTNTFALQSTTYYGLDLSGNVVAVYNKQAAGSVIQTELPIYGLSRLGVSSREGSNSLAQNQYEITDHLGNVRAVFRMINMQPDIVSYADYYPFGEQLPMRNSLSNYRYAFQGQEIDGETGMEAFQLRLWDGRLGRWLSPDPYQEFDSPYLGMGNNPISLTDPDGGSTEGCCPDPPVTLNGGVLNEVVIYSTRVAKPRDIGRDLSFIPKAPIFNFAIAPRASDDWWWNKLAYDGSRAAEYDGWRYEVNNDGFAMKGLGAVPQGGAGAFEFIGPGSGFKIVNAYKNAISLFKGNKLLTNVGRAVTKHPQYFGFESTEALMKVHRTPQALNNLGSSTLKNIIRNGAKTTGAGGRYPNGWVTYTLQNGNAASWGADGAFIGFRGGL